MGSFGFYSWAQEKVPWLLVPMLLPTVLLAAMWFAPAHRVAARSRGRCTALVARAVGALTLWSLVASNYLYDAPRPDENPRPRATPSCSRTCSRPTTSNKVMKRIEEVGNDARHRHADAAGGVGQRHLAAQLVPAPLPGELGGRRALQSTRRW